MTIALVHEAETLPAASKMEVGYAYRQLRLLVPGLATIGWMTSECPGCGYEEIVRRFSRTLECEAWLVGQPVGVDGVAVRGAPIGVAVIEVDGLPHNRTATEERLQRELETAKQEVLT